MFVIVTLLCCIALQALDARNVVQECVPGTNFHRECNFCHCTEDGKAACTKRMCQPGKCTPGHSYPAGDGCNICVCGENGELTACTEMYCAPEKVPVIHKILACTPGQSYPAGDGCNTCVCGDNGELSACTDMYCQPMDPNDPNFRCIPGERLDHLVGNSCTCATDGIHVHCTYE